MIYKSDRVMPSQLTLIVSILEGRDLFSAVAAVPFVMMPIQMMIFWMAKQDTKERKKCERAINFRFLFEKQKRREWSDSRHTDALVKSLAKKYIFICGKIPDFRCRRVCLVLSWNSTASYLGSSLMVNCVTKRNNFFLKNQNQMEDFCFLK